MDNRTKKTISVVANVLVWVFLAFAVLVTVFVVVAQSNSDGIPSIGGKAMITIESSSMKGKDGFSKGSLIFAKKLTAEEKRSCQEGDVVVFRVDLDGDGVQELNTHRIVGVYPTEGGATTYQTKGDNVSYNDPYTLNETQIIAKWTGGKIVAVGAVLNFMSNKTAGICIIVIPLILFFGWEVLRFVQTVRTLRGKKTITAEDEEEIKRRAVEEYLRTQGSAVAPTEKTEPEETPDTDDKNGDA